MEPMESPDVSQSKTSARPKSFYKTSWKKRPKYPSSNRSSFTTTDYRHTWSEFRLKNECLKLRSTFRISRNKNKTKKKNQFSFLVILLGAVSFSFQLWMFFNLLYFVLSSLNSVCSFIRKHTYITTSEPFTDVKSSKNTPSFSLFFSSFLFCYFFFNFIRLIFSFRTFRLLSRLQPIRLINRLLTGPTIINYTGTFYLFISHRCESSVSLKTAVSLQPFMVLLTKWSAKINAIFAEEKTINCFWMFANDFQIKWENRSIQWTPEEQNKDRSNDSFKHRISWHVFFYVLLCFSIPFNHRLSIA